MAKMLTHAFFDRPAEVVAKQLLGCSLCVRVGEKVERHIIIETEAYVGPHDLASHASKGRTARTEVMFKKAGTIYVYLIYGMYDMLNIVTGEKDYPAAVLIRGVGKWSGPGKLTKALHITRSLNGKKLGKHSGLWVEEALEQIPPDHIVCSPRIGVAYAKEWAKEELRFTVK
jgi:DNA-3-methyladenine glycosylase